MKTLETTTGYEEDNIRLEQLVIVCERFEKDAYAILSELDETTLVYDGELIADTIRNAVGYALDAVDYASNGIHRQ